MGIIGGLLLGGMIGGAIDREWNDVLRGAVSGAGIFPFLSDELISRKLHAQGHGDRSFIYSGLAFSFSNHSQSESKTGYNVSYAKYQRIVQSLFILGGFSVTNRRFKLPAQDVYFRDRNVVRTFDISFSAVSFDISVMPTYNYKTSTNSSMFFSVGPALSVPVYKNSEFTELGTKQAGNSKRNVNFLYLYDDYFSTIANWNVALNVGLAVRRMCVEVQLCKALARTHQIPFIDDRTKFLTAKYSIGYRF